MTWLGFLIIGAILVILGVVLHPPWKEICLVIGVVLLVLAAVLVLAGGVLIA
jgi:hypothetical protein